MKSTLEPWRAMGPRCPPLPGLLGPPGTGCSRLQLVPPVFLSHLHKLPDQVDSHYLVCQDPAGKVCQANPAGAHWPHREPIHSAAPARSPLAFMSLSKGHLPLAPTQTAQSQDHQSDLKNIPLGTITEGSLPHNSSLASPIQAVSGLGQASFSLPFLSCCWETTKTLSFSTSSQYQSQQEHLHHPHPRGLLLGRSHKEAGRGPESLSGPS